MSRSKRLERGADAAPVELSHLIGGRLLPHFQLFQALVFLFLVKVLMADERPLDPADYDMVGVLGRTSIPIRPGGTGEVVYTQGGTRHVAGARSEDGAAIAKGAEVIVTRYEKGLAYVRRWEDPAEEPQPKS